jgi:hypothetical protein
LLARSLARWLCQHLETTAQEAESERVVNRAAVMAQKELLNEMEIRFQESERKRKLRLNESATRSTASHRYSCSSM